MEFADLFRYCLVSFRGEYSLLLSDGWERGQHIQLMYHDRGIDSWHIVMAPGEHILIAPQESYELLTDCGFGKRSDLGGSVWIGTVESYLL